MTDVHLNVRAAQFDDMEAVALFAKQSFRETFFDNAGYNEDEFHVFIEEEYSEENLAR